MGVVCVGVGWRKLEFAWGVKGVNWKVGFLGWDEMG